MSGGMSITSARVIGLHGAVLAALCLMQFILPVYHHGIVARIMVMATYAIPVNRVYSGVFVAGAMLAAIAAVLIVPIQQAHYLMGLDPLLLSFIVVIIGGLGSLQGTILAALMIGMSDGIISVFFSPTLAKILATLLVALVLVYRPNGLFGEVTR